MRTNNFGYTRASTLDEALELMAAGAAPLAGGQWLLVEMKLGLRAPTGVVDVKGLTEYERVDIDEDAVIIGSLVRHVDVMQETGLANILPSLVEAANQIGDVQTRNRGTVGGNVCWGDSRANYGPVLASLDAWVQFAHPLGSRELAITDFLAQPGKVASGSFLEWVIVPRPGKRARMRYRELSRQPNDFALVNVAVVLDPDAERPIRIAIGGLCSHVVRLTPVERAAGPMFLDGGQRDLDALEAHVDQAVSRLDAVPHPTAPADYRRRMAAVMVRRAVEDLLREDPTPVRGG
jgi:aerobic carbon-monoxide dehydrogenase medium subunit